MKRVLALVALTSLTACSYLGLGDTQEQAVLTDPAPAAEVAAADPAAEPAAVESAGPASIKPPLPQSTLVIADAWALPSPRGAKVAAGFFTVANGGTDTDRLTSATSPRAARIELHEIVKDGGVVKMRPLTAGIDVPPGGSVTLKEDGTHVMFLDVDTPFADGETIPVALTFEKGGTIEVTMRVKKSSKIVAQH
jgi:copper(I)-binding protein